MGDGGIYGIQAHGLADPSGGMEPPAPQQPGSSRAGAYLRNVGVLVAGTAVAQAIPLAASPLLTRLFGPEDFGLVGLFLAISTVAAVISTGRYELAISLPAEDAKAASLAAVSAGCCLLTSVVSLAGVAAAGPWLARAAGAERLVPWLFLLPLSILASGSAAIYQMWQNRRRRYGAMAAARVQQAAAITAGNVGAGLAHAAGGMIPGTVLGQVLAAVPLWLSGWRDIRHQLRGQSTHSLLAVAHAFRSHPLHLVPSHLIGAIALQAPLVIMSSGYSIATAGMYALAHRVVTIPTLMIANAIGDVYRQEIAASYQATGRFEAIFRKTLVRTASLAILPAALIFLLAPQAFSVVFGPEWRVAGDYARILTVGGFFQFVLTPLDKGALVVGATRYLFWWHTARLAMLGGLFWAVLTLPIDVVTALWALTAIRVVLYVADAVIGYRFARGSGE
jgi:O-antigen/teichoic acid export membrane protein